MLAFRSNVSRAPRYAVVFPALLQTDRVRAHQNRISWFGEEAPNARVEIGDHGVKIGQIEHKACAPFARRDVIASWVLFDRNKLIGNHHNRRLKPPAVTRAFEM